MNSYHHIQLKPSIKRESHYVVSLFLWLSVLFSSVVEAQTLIFQSKDQSKPVVPKVIESAPVVAAPVVQEPAVKMSQVNELYFVLEQLKAEVSELRGTVEEQAYTISKLEKAATRRYKDLDGRVLGLSKDVSILKELELEAVRQPVAKVEEAPTVVPAVDPKLQKQEYDQAYSLVKERKYEEAVDALHGFIEKYPTGDLAGNAYYWLGEVYLVLPKLEQAKQAFSIVLRSFADHRKASDATFKLAVTYDRLQDPDNSEKFLKEVQSKFPESTAARLAKNYKINR